jgi:hypothetical protein
MTNILVGTRILKTPCAALDLMSGLQLYAGAFVMTANSTRKKLLRKKSACNRR